MATQMELLERLPRLLEELGPSPVTEALALRVLVACAQSGATAASYIARSASVLAFLRRNYLLPQDDSTPSAAAGGVAPPVVPARPRHSASVHSALQGLAVRVLRVACQCGRQIAMELCRSGVVNETKRFLAAEDGADSGDDVDGVLRGVDVGVEVRQRCW